MPKRIKPNNLFLKRYDWEKYTDEAGDTRYVVYDVEILDFGGKTPVAGLHPEIKKVLLSGFKIKWAKEAGSEHKRLESKGYFPPVHELHNKSGDPKNLRKIGLMSNIGLGAGSAGRQNPKVMYADIFDIDMFSMHEILRRKLPYRSVEIASLAVPKISSLALMFNTPPVFQFPMLVLGRDLGEKDRKVERKEAISLASTGDLIALSESESGNSFFITQRFMGGDMKKKRNGTESPELNIKLSIDGASSKKKVRKSRKDTGTRILDVLEGIETRLGALETKRRATKKKAKGKAKNPKTKAPDDNDDDRPTAFDSVRLKGKNGDIVLDADTVTQILSSQERAKQDKIKAKYERKLSALRNQGYVLSVKDEVDFITTELSSVSARKNYIAGLKKKCKKAPLGYAVEDMKFDVEEVANKKILKDKTFGKYLKKYTDNPVMLKFACDAVEELKLGNSDTGGFTVPKKRYRSYIEEVVAEKYSDARANGQIVGV